MEWPLYKARLCPTLAQRRRSRLGFDSDGLELSCSVRDATRYPAAHRACSLCHKRTRLAEAPKGVLSPGFLKISQGKYLGTLEPVIFEKGC